MQVVSINKAIKKEFPNHDIEVVIGDGYFYFDGDDGFDKIESIYVEPKSVCVDTAKRMILQHIRNMGFNNA